MKKYFLILLLGLPSLLLADTWLPAFEQTYYSENKLFKLTIYPAPDNLSKVSKKVREELFSSGTSTPYALLEKASGKSLKKIWLRKLINQPTSAIISNDGKYTVTFDSWGHTGYGNIVVVYDEAGNYKWSFDSLKEIASEDEIIRMERSVSSVDWGDHHFINNNNELVLGLKVGPEMIDNGKCLRCGLFDLSREGKGKDLLEIPSNVILKNWIDSGKLTLPRRVSLFTGELLDKPLLTDKYKFPNYSCPDNFEKEEGASDGVLEQRCVFEESGSNQEIRFGTEYRWRFGRWDWLIKYSYQDEKRDGVWQSKQNPEMKPCEAVFKMDEKISQTCESIF